MNILNDAVSVAEMVGGAIMGLGVVVTWFKAHQANVQRQRRVEDAIIGTKPQHGIPGTPSIFEQLATLSAKVETMQVTLSTVESEVASVKGLTTQLKPNGGKSLADKINRAELRTERIENKLDDHLKHVGSADRDLRKRIDE